MATNNPYEYSQDQIQQAKTIADWIEQSELSQAQFARYSSINNTTLSLVLTQDYISNPQKWLTQAKKATSNYDLGRANMNKITVETTVYKLVWTACEQARKNKNFSVFSSFVGTGKTHALKKYKQEHPNSVMVEVDPTMTLGVLVNQLAKEIGIYVSGNLAVKFEAIIEKVTNTDTLIIIDEAETLTPKALHLIRRLRDKANVGVVLTGTEHLRGVVLRERGAFDQIRSRVGFSPKTVESITKEDCAALVVATYKSQGTEDLIDCFWKLCKGSMRMLSEGLIQGVKDYQGKNELSVNLVEAIAAKLLTI